MEETGAD
jgi:hypothetical protein